jgi:hypothetical protein
MTMDPTETESAAPEIAPATRRGQAALAGAFVLALALLLAYQFIGLPYLKSAISLTAAPEAIVLVKRVLLGLVAPVALAGIYLIWYGRKIAEAGRYPLPEAWVWRDTPIRRGGAAVKLARLHYAAGAVIAVLGIGLAAYLWIMLDRLAPPIKLPPGVTILQQKSLPAAK